MNSLRSIHRLAVAVLSPVLAIAGLAMVMLLVAVNNAAAAMGFGTVTVALGANTIDNLIPDTYAALKVVSREICGLIPSVNRNSSADRLAIGQSLRSAAAPVNTAGKDITPAMALPAAADQVMSTIPFTLSKARAFPFSWSGEQQYAVNQGPGLLTLNQQQIAQAIRAAVNEISVDLYAAMRKGASRAIGTAGTTPFASTLDLTADVRKILDDNGTPAAERALVLDTSAGANVRKRLGGVLNAHPGIAAETLTQGTLTDINGFKIREDAKITAVTKGTAASATTDNAGYAVGATTITLASAGTGTILAGDCVTFAGDSNIYVVKTGDADVSNGGTIVLQEPGLLVAMSAATKAITVGGNFTANLAFSRDFAILGTRLPTISDPKDMAILREVVTDPVSGISFELAAYPGYRMVTFEIGVAWGQAVENPDHGALLLG
jgi:hypothetical protein